jgi:hypothetical protein
MADRCNSPIFEYRQIQNWVFPFISSPRCHFIQNWKTEATATSTSACHCRLWWPPPALQAAATWPLPGLWAPPGAQQGSPTPYEPTTITRRPVRPFDALEVPPDAPWTPMRSFELLWFEWIASIWMLQVFECYYIISTMNCFDLNVSNRLYSIGMYE